MSKRNAKLHPYLQAKLDEKSNPPNKSEFDACIEVPKNNIFGEMSSLRPKLDANNLKKMGSYKADQPILVAEGFLSAKILSEHLGIQVCYA